MTVELLPLIENAPYFTQAIAVYHECVAGDLLYHRHFFLTHMAREGYVGLCARVGKEIVGIAFGSYSLHHQWWHQRVIQHIDATHPALQNAWVFTQFNVLNDYRNQGIGGLLHDAILRQQPCQNVILSTQSKNDRAQRFYQRHGWQLLVDHVIFSSGDEPYAIFHKNLAMNQRDTEQLHPAGD